MLAPRSSERPLPNVHLLQALPSAPETSREQRAILALYGHRAALLRSLHGSFPTVPAEELEDAFQATLTDLVSCPERWEAAIRSGNHAIFALARVVAWRHVRGQLRRSASRHEVVGIGSDVLPEPAQPEFDLDAHRRMHNFGAHVGHAARRVGGARWEALRDALTATLCEPDATGLAVAERHQVPREYVSRALACLRQSLRDAA